MNSVVYLLFIDHSKPVRVDANGRHSSIWARGYPHHRSPALVCVFYPLGEGKARLVRCISHLTCRGLDVYHSNLVRSHRLFCRSYRALSGSTKSAPVALTRNAASCVLTCIMINQWDRVALVHDKVHAKAEVSIHSLWDLRSSHAVPLKMGSPMSPPQVRPCPS